MAEQTTLETYVRPELEVAGASNDILVMRVVEMSVQNLFGQGQWTVEPRQMISTMPVCTDQEQRAALTFREQQPSCLRYAGS